MVVRDGVGLRPCSETFHRNELHNFSIPTSSSLVEISRLKCINLDHVTCRNTTTTPSNFHFERTETQYPARFPVFANLYLVCCSSLFKVYAKACIYRTAWSATHGLGSLRTRLSSLQSRFEVLEMKHLIVLAIVLQRCVLSLLLGGLCRLC